MKIQSQEDALQYIDTELRKDAKGPGELGKAEINEAIEVRDHTAWSYYIEGSFIALNGMRFWLLDTGETVVTSIDEDANTIEKAYLTKYGRELVTHSS